MTFSEIVDRVAEDLNLTSTNAKARIGRHVNMRHKELRAKPWLQVTRRGVCIQPRTLDTQYLTFPTTKIYSIFNPAQYNQTINELSFDEVRNITPITDPPQNYAIAKQDATSTTVFFDAVASTTDPLHADCELRVLDMALNNIPGFNEDFHDALYYGAKYLELLKMEKPDLAVEANSRYDDRISDLKFHIAKTSYLTYLQGKDSAFGLPGYVNTVVA